MRPDVSNISRKSILCVSTTGSKDSIESKGHGRKLTQAQDSLYGAHGNDSYFESDYLESEVQDFSDFDQAIIADTPN